MARARKDPVCGVEVDPKRGKKRRLGGKAFYFCSEACRHKFSADPVSYLTPHP